MEAAFGKSCVLFTGAETGGCERADIWGPAEDVPEGACSEGFLVGDNDLGTDPEAIGFNLLAGEGVLVVKIGAAVGFMNVGGSDCGCGCPTCCTDVPLVGDGTLGTPLLPGPGGESNADGVSFVGCGCGNCCCCCIGVLLRGDGALGTLLLFDPGGDISADGANFVGCGCIGALFRGDGAMGTRLACPAERTAADTTGFVWGVCTLGATGVLGGTPGILWRGGNSVCSCPCGTAGVFNMELLRTVGLLLPLIPLLLFWLTLILALALTPVGFVNLRLPPLLMPIVTPPEWLKSSFAIPNLLRHSTMLLVVLATLAGLRRFCFATEGALRDGRSAACICCCL